MTALGIQRAIPEMPRPDFQSMKERALQAYVKKNERFLLPSDIRCTLTEIAGLIADRKAKEFVSARAEARKLSAAAQAASDALQKFPKGAMGLTPDDVKRSPKWRAAYQDYNQAAQALRKFNGSYTKTFAEELRHEREFRRSAGIFKEDLRHVE